MVDRSETVKKGINGLNFLRIEFGEVEVSNGDTVTLDGFDSVQNPLNVYMMKKSDGSEMTQTHAAGSNVVTITGAGVNIPCFYIAYGYAA